MRKYFEIQNLLWASLILALAGSLRHLAEIFASVDGNLFFGILQSVAIDCGLFALSYSLRGRKADKRPVFWVWVGIGIFTIISIYGNLAYGYLATSGSMPTWIVAIKPFILAASLPLLVLYLAEILSDNRQHVAEETARQQKILARKATKETGKTTENGNLASVNDNRKETKAANLERLAMLQNERPEASITELASLLDVSRGTVRNYLSEIASTNGNTNGHN